MFFLNQKLALMVMDAFCDMCELCFQNVAANKLCRHVGLGCTAYQGSSKPSPGL